jgi:peptide/nickel transport system ATP-binding protein
MQEELTIDWSVDSIEEISKKTGEIEPTLSLENLTVTYPKTRSIGQFLSGDVATAVEAISGVDLDIPRGRTLGLVGESGSGKTTLARAIVGLVEVEDGETRFMGRVLPRQLNRRDIDTIRQIQMVFQNPHEALNPYLTIGETLRRPLQRHSGIGRDQAQKEVVKLLDSVQLSPEFVQRFPGQLSGGEKQRVAIARAFASNPVLLVADEPVSSLDVSVQAAILNLLNTLQREFGGTYLFISHNLAVVGYFADVIAVIYLGRLMEVADASELFSPPYHPYTEALLAAIPTIKEGPRVERVLLEGDIPRVSEVTLGCPFHSRCPRSLGDLCRDHVPPWQVTKTGKRYFCHIDESELLQAQSSVWQDRKGREK